MKRNERMARAAAAFFLAALMLIGLWTVNDYTGSYDETAEQAILSSNMKEYALALERVGVRWAAWLESDAVPISQSIEKDHGISGYYLYGLLFPLIGQNETLRYTLWSVMTWLWFMAGVAAVYGFYRELGMSRSISGMGSLLMYLCPRFFAEGHYNNKDMVLLSLVLLTLWLGLRFLKQPNVRRGVLFSLAGALAEHRRTRLPML